MEFSFRPRNASGGPQLSALLSARDVEVFAQKEAGVLILGSVSATPSGRGDASCMFSGSSAMLPKRGRRVRQDRSVTRHATQMLSHSASPHPGQTMRQTMLHEYLRKLLLSPDEFMRLLEDPYSGRANDNSWPSGSDRWNGVRPVKRLAAASADAVLVPSGMPRTSSPR